MKGKILKKDSRNKVFIKPIKPYLSLPDGVIAGWGYFIDCNWEFAYSLEMGTGGEIGGAT